MAGFEDLIRTTLQKQGDPPSERRVAIYASSRLALERMLEKNTSLDEKAAQSQRDRLERAIEAIETDYQAREATASSTTNEMSAPPTPAPPSNAPAPPSPTAALDPQNEGPTATGLRPPPQPRLKPGPPPEPQVLPESQVPPVSTGAEREPTAPTSADDLVASREDTGPETQPTPSPTETQARVEPQFESEAPAGHADSSSQEPAVPSDYEGPVLKERKPFAKLLLWAIIIAGVGTAAWWGVTFGPELLKSQFDSSVRNPPARIETGSFVPEEQGGWISVFSPDTNPESIDTGNGSRAELVRIDGQTIARIASPTSDDNATIRIAVPPGVMESLRGKAATFELQIAGGSGDGHQFAVYCEFAEMGECGRKRFRARDRLEPYLFDMLVNDVSLGDGERAYVAIDTDIGKGGLHLDLHSIRVRSGG